MHKPWVYTLCFRPSKGMFPRIICCAADNLSRGKIFLMLLFTFASMTNLGQSPKMWEKSPIRYSTSPRGVLKYPILNFQPNSFQFGLLKHLYQDTQDFSHSSSVVLLLFKGLHLHFVARSGGKKTGLHAARGKTLHTEWLRKTRDILEIETDERTQGFEWM